MGVIGAIEKVMDWFWKVFDAFGKILELMLIIVPLLLGALMIAQGLAFEPTADTEVEATIVDTENVTEGGGSGTRERYELHVTYAYEYEGEKYESDDITPLKSLLRFDSEESRREAVNEKYWVGNSVIAHIDADDPETARLQEPEPQQHIGQGGIFLVFGVLMVARHLKKRIT